VDSLLVFADVLFPASTL